MKWRLIPNFATSYSLTLNNFKWFILCKLTLFWRYLIRVIVFGIIEIICSGCSKCTHKYKKLQQGEVKKVKIFIKNYININLAPKMQQKQSPKAPQINPAVPYSQLTYLQFCMLPSLFQDYMQLLLDGEEYNKMGDLFILYSQTLFQLKPMGINQDKIMGEMKNINQSAIGQQLLKLLTIIIKYLPIEHKPKTYSINVPNCLYTCIINTVVSQLSQQQGKHQSQQYQNQINNQITYYRSLIYYFVMLWIEDCINKGRKINNLAEKSQLMNQMSKFYFNNLDILRKANSFYGKYCQQFKKLVQKLKYVLQPTIQQKQKQQNIMQLHDQASKMHLNLHNAHINSLYFQCISQSQKISYINWCYNTAIKAYSNRNSTKSDTKIRQVELMCYLFLEQYKDTKLSAKYEIYLILIAIKIQNNQTIDGIFQEIKVLFSYQRVPDIQYSYFILYAIMGKDVDELQTSSIKDIIDLLLKTYSKIHNNDKSYVRLAILSSLFLHYIGNSSNTTPSITIPLANPPISTGTTSIKSINRKQMLQILCQFDDIISYINNKDILNYIVQLVFVGKEVKLFDFENPNAKNSNTKNKDSFMEIQHHNSNIFHNMLSYKQSQMLFYQYLLKISLTQETQPTQDHQLPQHKLLNLSHSILLKQKQLIAINQYSQYFHHKLLTFVFFTDGCSKFGEDVLMHCVSVLEEYFAVSYCTYVSEKIVKLMFVVLLYCLNEGFYKRQGLICFQLIQDKLPMDKIQSFIIQNSQNFRQLGSQLFECIVNYQLVQILTQVYKGKYDKISVEWIKNPDNYIYNWPEGKKQKILQGKRDRFIKYLKDKLMKNKEQGINI